MELWLLISLPGDGEISLKYLGEPNVITTVLKSGRRRKKGQRDGVEIEVRQIPSIRENWCSLASLKMEDATWKWREGTEFHISLEVDSPQSL